MGTKVCESLGAARSDLAYLRRTVAEVAQDYGLAIIAASTHPFGRPSQIEHTPQQRYNQLADDLQEVVRQLIER